MNSQEMWLLWPVFKQNNITVILATWKDCKVGCQMAARIIVHVTTNITLGTYCVLMNLVYSYK